MPETMGSRIRYARRQKVDLSAFAERINELLAERNQSMRAAAMSAGLDHQAVRRIIEGVRPTVFNCILLADYFDVNPNEFLELASWPTLKIFDIAQNQAGNLPPEVIDVALDLTKISTPEKRKKVVRAIRTLLRELAGWIPTQPARISPEISQVLQSQQFVKGWVCHYLAQFPL